MQVRIGIDVEDAYSAGGGLFLLIACVCAVWLISVGVFIYGW